MTMEKCKIWDPIFLFFTHVKHISMESFRKPYMKFLCSGHNQVGLGTSERFFIHSLNISKNLNCCLVQSDGSCCLIKDIFSKYIKAIFYVPNQYDYTCFYNLDHEISISFIFLRSKLDSIQKLVPLVNTANKALE